MARLIFGLYWILSRKQFIKYIRYTQYIKFMKYIYQFKYIYTKYIEWLDWPFADIGKQLIKYIPHWLKARMLSAYNHKRNGLIVP